MAIVRRATVIQNRNECVVVRVGVDRTGLAVWAGVLVAFLSLFAWVEFGSGLALLLYSTSAVVVPAIIVTMSRLARVRERTLVRTHGRLLLDGEPLELARVELRVLKWPLTSMPTGYGLSLWVMTASGPEDVPIGQFKTMLEATALSGTLEEFVGRASMRSTVTFR